MKKMLILLLLIVPVGAMSMVLRYLVVEPDQPSNLAAVPMQVGEWKGEDISINDATASVLKATDTMLRTYTDSTGNIIGIFIAYFRDQRYGSQIHSPRHCLPGGGWAISDLQHVPFDLGNREILCNRMKITRLSQVDQMFYWFHTRSGDLTSEYSLKLDLVKNSLLLSPTDAVIIRLTIMQGKNKVEECQRISERFMKEILPSIRQSLPFETI